MIANLVRTLLGAAIEGIQRYPVTASALVITAIIANLDIADVVEMDWAEKQRLYAAFSAFSFASLAKQIAIESRGYSRVVQHGAAVLAGAIMAALAWFAKDVGLSEFAFFAGLSATLLVSAHWFRGTSAGFWFFVVRLLFAVGLAFIAVIVFALGMSAIFASLEYLFGIDVPGNIYSYIWATSLIAAGPLFALGRIPEDFDALPLVDGDHYGIAGLRLLSDYLAAPLLAIYALILHAYALKIVISGDVPQNQIGWMVIGYGTLIIFFWKVMLPLREVLTLSGRLFLRFWPFMIIVPMALLFYALWLRIGDYGVTPDRYFLAAFGILMTIFALMQAIPRLRNSLPAAAPLTAMALLLGGFGPWGAETVSLKSQIWQFAGILDDESRVIAGEGKRAANILRYLNNRDALPLLKEAVANLAPQPFKFQIEEEDKYKRLVRLEKAIGVDEARKDNDSRKGRKTFNFSKAIVSVEGYDWAADNIPLNPPSSGSSNVMQTPDIIVSVDKFAIIIEQGEVKYRFSLEPIGKFAQSAPQSPKVQVFELQSGEKKILFVPRYISINTNKEFILENAAGSIFLRSNDWE